MALVAVFFGLFPPRGERGVDVFDEDECPRREFHKEESQPRVMETALAEGEDGDVEVEGSGEGLHKGGFARAGGAVQEVTSSVRDPARTVAIGGGEEFGEVGDDRFRDSLVEDDRVEGADRFGFSPQGDPFRDGGGVDCEFALCGFLTHGADLAHDFSEEGFLAVKRGEADGFPHVSRCEVHGFFARAIDFEECGFVAHEEMAYPGDHFKVFFFGAMGAGNFFGGVG